jgi:predicted hotdog family 3-hydroxylacyl-ACP dehydratase
MTWEPDNREAFPLPHGEGLRLVQGAGVTAGEWRSFPVTIQPSLSALSARGEAAPELGLEVMAQACGMLLANKETQDQGATSRIGFVGAARSYRYEPIPFRVGEQLEVRVKPELLEESLVVCEAELYRGANGAPAQSARITLSIRAEGLP